jgi:hypothetical protein
MSLESVFIEMIRQAENADIDRDDA